MKIVTRKQAKLLGLKRYFTGKPCKNGHINERILSNNTCLDCQNLKSLNNYHNNKSYHSNYYENRKEEMIEYRKLKKEHIKEVKRNHYISNKELYKVRARNQYLKNPVPYKERAINRKINIQLSSKLVSNELLKNQIKLIYEQCNKITKETGILHHVDHIVPINNSIVCGLHVPWNLQILTSEENLRKSNFMLVDGIQQR